MCIFINCTKPPKMCNFYICVISCLFVLYGYCLSFEIFMLLFYAHLRPCVIIYKQIAQKY